jgi:hypothetical protein
VCSLSLFGAGDEKRSRFLSFLFFPQIFSL